jgi:hypothetical protein
VHIDARVLLMLMHRIGNKYLIHVSCDDWECARHGAAAEEGCCSRQLMCIPSYDALALAVWGMLVHTIV